MDDEYFTSYDVSVHELMLKDVPRMESYYSALEKNKDLLKDKVVLDVGAGTGVLSMFAAKLGAKKVYAIEANTPVAELAATIVAENELSEIVTVLNAKVEDVELPEKVDIIISEWMGFYLLHESMLESVLIARDSHLKEGGTIFPRICNIYAAPISMSEFYQEKHNYFSNLYGLNFTPIIPQIMAQQPKIQYIKNESQLLANPQIFETIDCLTVTVLELQYLSKRFYFTTNVDGVFHGFALWFDVSFERIGNDKEVVSVLTTAPGKPKTHWKQTLLLLPGNGFNVTKLTDINCRITMTIDEMHPRRYNLTLSMSEDDEEEEEEEQNEEMDN